MILKFLLLDVNRGSRCNLNYLVTGNLMMNDTSFQESDDKIELSIYDFTRLVDQCYSGDDLAISF